MCVEFVRGRLLMCEIVVCDGDVLCFGLLLLCLCFFFFLVVWCMRCFRVSCLLGV